MVSALFFSTQYSRPARLEKHTAPSPTLSSDWQDLSVME
jgi:hypothetical protein